LEGEKMEFKGQMEVIEEEGERIKEIMEKKE
jgi:hypothetical protein